jgi:hypothetical protein
MSPWPLGALKALPMTAPIASRGSTAFIACLGVGDVSRQVAGPVSEAYVRGANVSRKTFGTGLTNTLLLKRRLTSGALCRVGSRASPPQWGPNYGRKSWGGVGHFRRSFLTKPLTKFDCRDLGNCRTLMKATGSSVFICHLGLGTSLHFFVLRPKFLMSWL